MYFKECISILDFLCSQEAIFLENARLYEESQQSLDILRESEQRFRYLFESTPTIAMQCYNRHRQVIAWNTASESLYGYSQAEALGKQLEDLIIPPQMREWVIQAVNKWLFEEIPIPPSELGLMHKDGSIVSVYSSHAIFTNMAGEKEMYCFDIDIRDRKAAEVAIKQKSQELEQALQYLQEAQLQIVQSEKMSALGNLVAGVAHEINNPVCFIGGNVQEAVTSVKNITEYLRLYQEKFPNPGDEITQKAAELEIEYLLEDLPKMLRSMEVGCERIKNISNSLTTFSRSDKDYKVLFDIRKGIDSTILILKHRLKANKQRPAIEISTKYDNLPEAKCFPGQLNQVFMNIIANAIDALDESSIGRSCTELENHPNRIIIKTFLEDDCVKISISDNGKGMSEEVQQKIFDRQFTTKSVGKGTGLGLAIARQIVVDKHGGNLEVSSVLGEGTEFIITIPLNE